MKSELNRDPSVHMRLINWRIVIGNTNHLVLDYVGHRHEWSFSWYYW